MIGLSRRMLAIIKINMAFGVDFNALAVVASGFAGPMDSQGPGR